MDEDDVLRELDKLRERLDHILSKYDNMLGKPDRTATVAARVLESLGDSGLPATAKLD